jgi:pimeloyl-ACP methyl ester carboxylesterase
LAAAGAVLAAACTPAPDAPLLPGMPTPQRTVVPGPAIARPSGHRPVLIVPGWALLCENGPPTEWQTWLDEFAAAGYAPGEVEVYQGSRCEPNTTTAGRVGTVVDDLLARTGQEKVDLIAHSMGALGARWCQKFGSCAGKVAHVVTLSGANHGTIWANACLLQFWSQACGDMTPGSPMLTALNAGDETPDDVSWTTYVSWCELVILPHLSDMLDGADNHYLTDRCVLHDDWKEDVATAREVVGLFADGAVA